MTLTTRFTKSGRQKQRRDEFAAWKTLVDNANGTPTHGALVGITTFDIAGNVTAITTTSPLYATWKDAPPGAPRRAPSDRQREQAALAAGTPVPNDSTGAVLPCRRITPALRVRDTIRMAILAAPTLEDHGGGTRLSAGPNKASTAELHDYLDSTLATIEAALRDPATNREEHDLRAAGHPPVQVFLASEWYYRRPGRPYSQAERDAIVQRLEALSRKYPEWLLVPGSIYWSPDNIHAPPVRVYNEAPFLFSGSLLGTRIKRESHDIDGDCGAEHRWGPDYPHVTGGAVPHPPGMVGSMAPAIFTHRGHVVSVEICRDHTVGDAVDGMLASATPAGADIYLFMSNGTTLEPKFLPVRHNGVGAWCDGFANGASAYFRVTRVNPLNNAPGLMTTYRTDFATARDHVALMNHHLDDAALALKHANATLRGFMTRFDAVFAGASSDPPLKASTDLAIAGVPAITGILAPYQGSYQKGLRIQQLLVTGALPTGTAISAAEVLAVTPYMNSLLGIGPAGIAAVAARATCDLSKIAALAGFDTVRTALNPPAAPVPAVFGLTVHGLVDLL